MRATAHFEQIRGNREAIVVTELPFMVKKGGDGGVIRKIVELVDEKKLTEISDIQDHSDRNGMRVVIELKRDANPKVVLNKLYKHTPMQTTFGVNMVALVENVPKLLSLQGRHPQLRPPPARGHRPARQARAARASSARVHRLEGLLIALDHLDEVIALIRSSRDRDTARTGLMERFELSLHPGPGDPRAAPAAADRPRGRHAAQGARGQDGADPRAAASCSATRTWSSS